MIDSEDKGVLITSSELGASSVRHRSRRAASARLPRSASHTHSVRGRAFNVGEVGEVSERSSWRKPTDEIRRPELRSARGQLESSSQAYSEPEMQKGHLGVCPGRPSRVDSDNVEIDGLDRR